MDAQSIPQGKGAMAAWAWAVVGGCVCASMSLLEPNVLEEGMMLHVGERLLAGEHLYRDIRLFTGPLPFAMTAASFLALGPSVLSARWGVVLLQAAASAAAYGVARRSGVGAWAHAAAACLATAPVFFFPLLSTNFYTTVATSAAFGVSWLALRGVVSSRFAFAAGVGIAAVALCKQTIGLALLVTLAPAAVLCAPGPARLRRLAALAGGGAVATLATLAWFLALGDLEIFVASMLDAPRSETFGSSFINLWPPGKLSDSLSAYEHLLVPWSIFLMRGEQPGTPPSLLFLTLLLYALPFLVLGCALLVRLRRPLPAGAWMLLGVLASHATNLYPRADSGHLTFVAPAAVACLLVVLPRPGPRGRARRVRPVLAAGVVAALVAMAGLFTARFHALSVEADWGPRIDVRPVSKWQRSDAMPRVIGFLRERLEPDEAIFVARSEPLVYFATGARNPTPFTGALQVWGVRGEQQEEILGAIRGVRFVVVTDVDGPLQTYFREELPEVQAELERHFHLPARFEGHLFRQSWILVLERGGDRGPTAVDLVEATRGARFWRRTPGGTLASAEIDPDQLPPRFRPTPGEVGDLSALQEVLPNRLHRRPLALPLESHGTGVDYRMTVPEAARFQAGVGIGAIGPMNAPSGVTFKLSLRREGLRAPQRFEELGSWRVVHREGRRRTIGMRWEPVVVDLSAYAGQEATLRLEVEPPASPRGGRWAFWGSPRIALVPAPPDDTSGDRS
jgi:4-amino-4-deoxy-L-arabinose transferase-like glycosyltransferase